MGCIGSHIVQLATGSGNLQPNPQNTFSVLNVDEMGRNLQTGKLQVTETDLVLYVRGKTALTWPLRSLRRYGYEADLFSFESGRRCPSGPGIYAFKCLRAQSLFELLQANIQRNNPSSLPPVPTTPITPTPLNSLASLSPTFDYVNISENQNNRAITSMTTTLIDQEDRNDTIHSTAMNNTSTSINLSQDNNQPLYMNVESHNLPCCSLTNNGNTSNNINNIPQQKLPSNGGAGDIKIIANSRLLYNNTCNNGGNSSSSSSTFFPADYPSCLNPVHSTTNSCGAGTGTVCNSVYYSNVDCSHIQTTTSSSSLTTTTTDSTTMAATTSFVNNGNVAAEVNYAELDLETDAKITTVSSTTITAFNSTTTTKVSNPKKLRLSTLGGSLSDDRFRANSQFDHHNSNIPLHDNEHDSIFSSVVDSSVANLNSSNSNNNATSISSVEGPAAGYATIDFDRTAALSVITRKKIQLNCNQEDEGTMRKTRHNSTAL